MAPAPPECAIGRTSTVTGAPRAGMRKEQMMKEYYKIGEISKLYNIGTDSLRYYEEIGILRPRRDENGYRMYSIGDIRTLNVLRELRSIGFPMKDIKAHLKDFDVQQTLDMFAEAIERINRRQQELELLKKNVSERIDEISYYLREKNTHESISVQSLPERHILKLSEKALRDDNIDFVLKKLQSKYEEQLYIVGNGEIGALIDSDCLLEGEYGRFEAEFYIVAPDEEFDAVLPAADYLCMTVKGSYARMREEWSKLLVYAQREGVSVCGSGVELYLIDNHDTNKENEFITELQIAVR